MSQFFVESSIFVAAGDEEIFCCLFLNVGYLNVGCSEIWNVSSGGGGLVRRVRVR